MKQSNPEIVAKFILNHGGWVSCDMVSANLDMSMVAIKSAMQSIKRGEKYEKLIRKENGRIYIKITRILLNDNQASTRENRLWRLAIFGEPLEKAS